MEVAQFDFDFLGKEIENMSLHFNKNQFIKKGDTVQFKDSSAGINAYYKIASIKYKDNHCSADLKLVKVTKSTTIDLRH